MQMLKTGILVTTLLVLSFAAHAADQEGSLANKVRHFCNQSQRGQSCIEEQLLAARQQKELFTDAFASKTSEGLTQIAIIARCTKQSKTPAGIDYVMARDCTIKAQNNP
tara:strand:- start:1278 stop:1604 length:327 start_codon:yes stop_codon:yes gene_type:complete